MKYQELFDMASEPEAPGTPGGTTAVEVAEITATISPSESLEIDELRRFAATLEPPTDRILFTTT